ncbi:MAG: DUF2878 domain-containing protein [Betaproteobacteria bacterium]
MSLPHAAPSTAARPSSRDARDALAPSRLRLFANFVIFEAAWFAAIVGAAHGAPAWGTAAVVAAIAWHVAISARPLAELALAGLLCAIGGVAESLVVMQGHVAYPSGQPVAWLAPYWLVALWGEFAIALNVTLRWLKHRPLLAAALGAVAGPLSFVGGVRLGGARFVDTTPALITLAVMWGLLMPLVMALSNRFEGVAVPPAPEGSDA